MTSLHRNIICVYLWLHLLLMLVTSVVIWFPVFFVLYGGIQAVVLLAMLKKERAGGMSVSRQKIIYILALTELAYTVALLYVGAYACCDGCGFGVPVPDCMKGTIFTNPEFFHIMPGVCLSAFYLLPALIWGIVYSILARRKKV